MVEQAITVLDLDHLLLKDLVNHILTNSNVIVVDGSLPRRFLQVWDPFEVIMVVYIALCALNLVSFFKHNRAEFCVLHMLTERALRHRVQPSVWLRILDHILKPEEVLVCSFSYVVPQEGLAGIPMDLPQ